MLAEALKQNRTVSKLGLYGNRITDVGAFVLADALQTNKTLKSCDVKGTDAMTPRGFDAVESAMKSRAMKRSTGWAAREYHRSQPRRWIWKGTRFLTLAAARWRT